MRDSATSWLKKGEEKEGREGKKKVEVVVVVIVVVPSVVVAVFFANISPWLIESLFHPSSSLLL